MENRCKLVLIASTIAFCSITTYVLTVTLWRHRRDSGLFDKGPVRVNFTRW